MQTAYQGASPDPIFPAALISLDALDGLTVDQAAALAWQLSPFDADRRTVLALGLAAWINQKGA